MLKKIKSVVTLLLLVLLAGCAQENDKALRIGTNTWPGYEPLYLSRELGLLDPSKVRLVEYSSTSQVLQAFRNELLDGAGVTLDEAMTLLETSEQLKIVLVMDISNGGDVLLAKPGIDKLPDIAGKTVGVEGTAVGAYMMTRILEKAGLKRSDINILQLTIDQHLKAFTEDKVDALVTFDPVRSRLLNLGAVQLFDSSEIPGEIVDILVVRESVLKNRRGQVEYLKDAWFQALDYFDREPEKSAAIMGQRLQLDTQQTLDIYKGIRFPDRAENNTFLNPPRPSLVPVSKKMARLMTENGLLKKIITPDQLFLH